MKIILKAGILFLRLIYCVYKLFPIKNRIVFFSRQSNEASVDAMLLANEVYKKDSQVQIIQEFKCIPDSWMGKIGYCFYMLTRQMYLFATSKVVILDGYCILASVLNHKKDLRIVQMWHAMGALKKFGYAALGNEEGKDPEISKILQMHRNYDYVICSSENCVNYYEEAFRIEKEKIIIASLPRVDLLVDSKKVSFTQEKIYKTYPNLRKKKNILYVPTFRMNAKMQEKVQDLIAKIDLTKYNLIVKLHPLTKENMELGQVLECEEYSALELLDIADYVISDYSAFIFEVAVAQKPLFLYTFDLEEYIQQRGFFIDYCKEMPSKQYRCAGEVAKAIERDEFDMKKIKQFADEYVEYKSGCSQKLADFICALYNNDIDEN